MTAMSSSTAPLHQSSDVGEASDVSEVLRETTAEPHTTKDRSVDDYDCVMATVGVIRLPLTDVQPVYTRHTTDSNCQRIFRHFFLRFANYYDW